MASVKIRGIQKCFGVTADPALAQGTREPKCLVQDIIDQYIDECRQLSRPANDLRGLTR